ncbi:MAG: histidine kinase [Acidobacteriota bacterium]|nr:histidine kinase [Acidobacteriota bacterium]
MIAPNAAEVLNLVGFVTGTALYAMLLALVLRGTPGAKVQDHPPPPYLPLATGVLGLIWNLGELAAYSLPRLGYFNESIGLWAIAFPALGLLAAVVVHSVARALPRGVVLTVIAYGCSIVASVLHLQTVITGNPEPSSLAFLILTICYGLIILALGVLTRAQANGQRVLWVLALALFAVSASHLGRFHAAADGWAVELVGHHAAIPLAFAILYQDYRFALADLFLKRALTLIALVAIAFAGYSLATLLPAGPLAASLLMALWVATSLVSPWLHRLIVRFVDHSLLGRTDYAALAAGIGQALQARNSIDGVLEMVAERLAPALDARRVWWGEDGAAAGGGLPRTTQALVPTTDLPRYVVNVGELTGGRRLLSDDLALVETVVATAARRIDQIRLTHERYEVQLREEEMQKLTAEAELKALRAQVNPHFLFNALTTIGYLIESAPPRAMNTLMQLTALLRGVLRSEGDFTTLGREIELVEHYLKIEHERFEERLRVHVNVPQALRHLRIPALVVQPLVENAIKHGVAPSTTGGDVEVAALLDAVDGVERLHIVVRNTGAPLHPGALRDLGRPTIPPGAKVGVDNVRRRLAGHYGASATLTLAAEAGRGTVAELVVPLATAAELEKDDRDAQAVAGRTGRR